MRKMSFNFWKECNERDARGIQFNLSLAESVTAGIRGRRKERGTTGRKKEGKRKHRKTAKEAGKDRDRQTDMNREARKAASAELTSKEPRSGLLVLLFAKEDIVIQTRLRRISVVSPSAFTCLVLCVHPERLYVFSLLHRKKKDTLHTPVSHYHLSIYLS